MLDDNIDGLKQKSSIEMLSLIPEYKNRKKVLYVYIDVGFMFFYLQIHARACPK